jgi:hypothetical protein
MGRTIELFRSNLEILDLFANLPTPRNGDSTKFSTEVFLHSIFVGSEFPDSDMVLKKLDRLCKKVDVVRKIRVFYTLDLTRNAAPVADIQKEYLPLLAAVLLSYAKNYRDLKFLNTAFKMLDGHLKQTSVFPDRLRNWAEILLVDLVP